MATWTEFSAAAPELAERVKASFDAHKHKTMATLRKDGSPRISGIEVEFAEGEAWIGSMGRAVKALDLQRDPRVAIHSATFDPDKDWPGEAKVAGVAEEIVDEQAIKERNGDAAGGGPSHLFRLDVREASTVGLDEARTKLLIEVWTPERGVRVIER